MPEVYMLYIYVHVGKCADECCIPFCHISTTVTCIYTHTMKSFKTKHTRTHKMHTLWSFELFKENFKIMEWLGGGKNAMFVILQPVT